MTGTYLYTYYGEGAPQTAPQSLVGVTVAAYVWSGTQWTTYPGSGDAQGNFTIPNVPAGEAMVAVDGLYLSTTARTLDFGYDLVGRPNAVAQKQTNTVAGTVANLDAWASSDVLQWYDANAPGFAQGPDTAIATGATTLPSSATTVWGGDLIDAARGDVLYLTQLGLTQIDPDATSYAVTRFVALSGVEQTDGTPLVVTGSFSTPAASEELKTSFAVSAFTAVASSINPNGSAGDPTLSITTQPGAAAAGAFGTGAPLYQVLASADQALDATYANPYNPAWGEIANAVVSTGVTYTAPGASSGVTQFGSIFVNAPVGAGSTGTPTSFAPTVTPVTSPTIDQQALFANQTLADLTPTLAWTAPATGTPSGYVVFVYRVQATGTGTVADYLTEIVTTGTSVVIPPGLLSSGASYAFTIQAQALPQVDMSTSPFRWSPSACGADVVSGLITVQ